MTGWWVVLLFLSGCRLSPIPSIEHWNDNADVDAEDGCEAPGQNGGNDHGEYGCREGRGVLVHIEGSVK
jgi:hypothetical protein